MQRLKDLYCLRWCHTAAAILLTRGGDGDMSAFM